jgi:ribonucleotide monophosphatase NagD (HAD superfamily)
MLHQFIMIGDNLQSDIEFAIKNKIDNCLVLTGVQVHPSVSEFEIIKQKYKINFVCESIKS